MWTLHKPMPGLDRSGLRARRATPGILYIFRKIERPLNFQCLRSVRYNRADKIRAMEYSALRMSGLEVCMAGCWWVDVEIPYRFKTLILFFFQTVNMFWILFEPWCYLEFMQQNKITYAYILINFIFLKKSTFKVYYCNIWVYIFNILDINFQHFHIKCLTSL